VIVGEVGMNEVVAPDQFAQAAQVEQHLGGITFGRQHQIVRGPLAGLGQQLTQVALPFGVDAQVNLHTQVAQRPDHVPGGFGGARQLRDGDEMEDLHRRLGKTGARVTWTPWFRNGFRHFPRVRADGAC
jgi:hypothetical protein